MGRQNGSTKIRAGDVCAICANTLAANITGEIGSTAVGQSRTSGSRVLAAHLQAT